MSGKTNISWTDMQWNAVSGCSKVSPGCANCYAEALTKRYAGRPGWPAEFRPWTPENAAANVVLHPDRLDAPLHWRTPRRIFVNSMSDLFHENVPDEFIDEVLGVTTLAGQHTFQVLTKRPERMLEYFRTPDRGTRICLAAAPHWSKAPLAAFAEMVGPEILPLENVHLGVSVENQHWADERIPLLLQTPAAVRFVSCEPLLGPVDLTMLRDGQLDALAGDARTSAGEIYAGGRGLDWVICGGESGPHRRPFDLAWARSLRDQCRAAGVAYFFKQTGALKPGQPSADPELDGCKEFPAQ